MSNRPALIRIFGVFAMNSRYFVPFYTILCLCYLSSNNVVPLRDIPSSTRVLLDNLKKKKNYVQDIITTIKIFIAPNLYVLT